MLPAPRERRGPATFVSRNRPSRRLAEAEYARALGAGELLEVAEDEDFAVGGVQGVEGFLQLLLPLGAKRRLAGPRIAAEELGRERSRGQQPRLLAICERAMQAVPSRRLIGYVRRRFSGLFDAR